MCTFVNMQIDLAIGIDFTNMYIRLFTLPFNLASQAKQKYKKITKNTWLHFLIKNFVDPQTQQGRR